MRRPYLTQKRVQALLVLAEKARPAARSRRDGLFTGTRVEREQMRLAIAVIDDLVSWSRSKTRDRIGAK